MLVDPRSSQRLADLPLARMRASADSSGRHLVLAYRRFRWLLRVLAQALHHSSFKTPLVRCARAAFAFELMLAHEPRCLIVRRKSEFLHLVRSGISSALFSHFRRGVQDALRSFVEDLSEIRLCQDWTAMTTLLINH